MNYFNRENYKSVSENFSCLYRLKDYDSGLGDDSVGKVLAMQL